MFVVVFQVRDSHPTSTKTVALQLSYSPSLASPSDFIALARPNALTELFSDQEANRKPHPSRSDIPPQQFPNVSETFVIASHGLA